MKADADPSTALGMTDSGARQQTTAPARRRLCEKRKARGWVRAVGVSTDCSRLRVGVMLSAVEGGDGDICVAGDDFVWIGVDTDSVVCGGAGETDQPAPNS